MICKKCGTEFEGNFCHNCGASSKQDNGCCPVCKTPRTEDKRYCHNCGYDYVNKAYKDNLVQQNVTVTSPKQQKSTKIWIIVLSIILSISFLAGVALGIVVVFQGDRSIKDADKIQLGLTKAEVIEILGQPYEITDNVMKYYDKSYVKLLQSEKSNVAKNIVYDSNGILQTTSKQLSVKKDASNKLENFVHEYLEIELDTAEKVSSVYYDARRTEATKNKLKTSKSVTINPDTVVKYVPTDIYYEVQFTDGSFYKGIAISGYVATNEGEYVMWSDNGYSFSKYVSSQENPDIKYQGKCGPDVIYQLDADGVLTISGSGNMTTQVNLPVGMNVKTIHLEADVTAFDVTCVPLSVDLFTVDADNQVFSSLEGVLVDKATGTQLIRATNSANIPSNITHICDNAFMGYQSIVSITIPTSIKSIGFNAFKGCTNLKSITLPFVGASLEGTENTHFGYIFGANSYAQNQTCIPATLTDVEITACTTLYDYTFVDCTSIESLTLPSSLEEIAENAFWGCDSLQNIVVDSANQKFYSPNNCIIDKTNQTLLLGCQNSIIPTDGSVTAIAEYAFAYCSKLTEITVPDSVVSIGFGAFLGCYSLEKITLPFVGEMQENTANKHFGYIFGAKNNSSNGNFVPSTLSQVVITTATSIGGNAFSKCANIESIVLPDTLESIGDFVFIDCDSLVDIQIDKANQTYYSINNCIVETDTKTLIAGCKSSVIPHDGSVTSIGSGAFYHCQGLVNVEIPDTITSIGVSAFSGCQGLISISIGNGVTVLDSYSFSGCNNLESIKLGSGLEYINGSAYDSCYNLVSLTVDENNVNLYSVDNCIIEKSTKTLLAGCKTSIIPQDGSVTKIGYSAFYGCIELTDINIPENITEIGKSAFQSCQSLTTIVLPKSLTKIDDWAFNFCNYIKQVYYSGYRSDWSAITVGISNTTLNSTNVYYYSESQPYYDGNYWHYVDNVPTKW